MSTELPKDFAFRHETFVNGEHRWSTAVLFTDEPEKSDFYITAGDWDGAAGDLDEWIYISYTDAPALNNLFAANYGTAESIELSQEQLSYAEGITNPAAQMSFRYLSRYFTADKGSFDSFRKLLDDNHINYEYSAYRSSSDW